MPMVDNMKEAILEEAHKATYPMHSRTTQNTLDSPTILWVADEEKRG